MRHENRRQKLPQYKAESWREEDGPEARDQRSEIRGHRSGTSGFSLETKMSYLADHGPREPSVRDQTKLLDLIGKINFKIIKGKRVYIEVGGVVYRTLYGGYWRSVFTGVDHYLFRCEQVSGSVWADDSDDDPEVDLPIVYSNDGWTASGHSLSFMLARE